MGKSLVIKGADFSENGISTSVTWVAQYPSNILAGESGKVVSNTTVYSPLSTEVARLGMVGKTIRYIKLNAAAAGTITVYKVTSGTTSDQKSYSVSAGNNIIELETPISITSDSVAVGIKGNGIIRYWSGSASFTSRGWTYNSSGVARIPIDFGY